MITMAECFGKNFILNGELQPAVLFNNSLVYEGDSIYEVIRLINGTPVFFSDHMERLVCQCKESEQGTFGRFIFNQEEHSATYTV